MAKAPHDGVSGMQGRKKYRLQTFRPDALLGPALDIVQQATGSSVSRYIRNAIVDRMRVDGLLDCTEGGLVLSSKALAFLSIDLRGRGGGMSRLIPAQGL